MASIQTYHPKRFEDKNFLQRMREVALIIYEEIKEWVKCNPKEGFRCFTFSILKYFEIFRFPYIIAYFIDIAFINFKLQIHSFQSSPF